MGWESLSALSSEHVYSNKASHSGRTPLTHTMIRELSPQTQTQDLRAESALSYPLEMTCLTRGQLGSGHVTELTWSW